jgi:hypothetical protein
MKSVMLRYETKLSEKCFWNIPREDNNPKGTVFQMVEKFSILHVYQKWESSSICYQILQLSGAVHDITA